MGALLRVFNRAERRRAGKATVGLWPGEFALSVATHFHDHPIGLSRDVLTTKRLIGSRWEADQADGHSSQGAWLRVSDIVAVTAMGRSTYIVVPRHRPPAASRAELPFIACVLRWRSENAGSFFAELRAAPRDRRWPPTQREPLDPSTLTELELLQLLVRPGSDNARLLAEVAAEVRAWARDRKRSPVDTDAASSTDRAGPPSA